jgi:HTH-type transcriptional regulator, sugar sensing transcriptional regulator
MFEENSLISGLQSMDFSERQAKVYSALLTTKDASLADLKKKSGIPQNKISEVVNSLVRQGFCSEKKIEKRKYFNVTNPASSLKNTLNSMQEKLYSSINLVQDIGKMYQSIDSYKEPLDYIEVIRGNNNIHDRFCQINQSAQHEILSFNKPPWAALTAEEKKEQGDILADFMKNKGESKAIYEIQSMDNDDILDILNRDLHEGELGRVSETLPMKMFIFDRKLLLIADTTNPAEIVDLRMVLINQQTIVNAFVALFDFFWQKAFDVDIWKGLHASR